MEKFNQDKLAKIVKRFNLKLILLFGSQVDGKTHQESDVDLAYLSNQDLTPKQEIDLNYDFTSLCQTSRVDTIDLRIAPPLFLKQILDNHQIVYQESPLVFSVFEAMVLQKYQEARPLFQMRHRRLKEFVASL